MGFSHCGPASVTIGGPFFRGADYSYVCKALSGFDPRVPLFVVEAWAGIEPAIELLQSSALPLGYHAVLQSRVLTLGRLERFANRLLVSSRFSAFSKIGLSLERNSGLPYFVLLH